MSASDYGSLPDGRSYSAIPSGWQAGWVNQVTIYSDSELESPVDDAVLLRISDSWDKEDESFCSGRGKGGENVLALSFEMEGELDEPTVMAAKARVESFVAGLRLHGRVTRVCACTEEAWYEWKDDD